MEEGSLRQLEYFEKSTNHSMIDANIWVELQVSCQNGHRNIFTISNLTSKVVKQYFGYRHIYKVKV
jgi:hypothetical protein